MEAKGDAKILLAHQPDHFTLAKKLKVNLQISGIVTGDRFVFLSWGRSLSRPSGAQIRRGVHEGKGCHSFHPPGHRRLPALAHALPAPGGEADIEDGVMVGNE